MRPFPHRDYVCNLLARHGLSEVKRVGTAPFHLNPVLAAGLREAAAVRAAGTAGEQRNSSAHCSKHHPEPSSNPDSTDSDHSWSSDEDAVPNSLPTPGFSHVPPPAASGARPFVRPLHNYISSKVGQGDGAASGGGYAAPTSAPHHANLFAVKETPKDAQYAKSELPALPQGARLHDLSLYSLAPDEFAQVLRGVENYRCARGSPCTSPAALNLYVLYHAVGAVGGMRAVDGADSGWERIARTVHGDGGVVRRVYEEWLLPLEGRDAQQVARAPADPPYSTAAS